MGLDNVELVLCESARLFKYFGRDKQLSDIMHHCRQSDLSAFFLIEACVQRHDADILRNTLNVLTGLSGLGFGYFRKGKYYRLLGLEDIAVNLCLTHGSVNVAVKDIQRTFQQSVFHNNGKFH